MNAEKYVKADTLEKDQNMFVESPGPLFEKKRKVMHKWTDEEDQALCILVSKKGSTQWSSIAKSIPGRSGKQCRERWYNHLNPAITHLPWTEEEDELLREYQRKMGNQWTKIAEKLSGRSENEVKNRANSLIRKAKTMNRRFQKSINKLIPPSNRTMMSNMNVMENQMIQPIPNNYYTPVMPAYNGSQYKQLYSYDINKTIPPASQIKRTSEQPTPLYYTPYNVYPTDKSQQTFDVMQGYQFGAMSNKGGYDYVSMSNTNGTYPAMLTPQGYIPIHATTTTATPPASSSIPAAATTTAIHTPAPTVSTTTVPTATTTQQIQGMPYIMNSNCPPYPQYTINSMYPNTIPVSPYANQRIHTENHPYETIMNPALYNSIYSSDMNINNTNTYKQESIHKNNSEAMEKMMALYEKVTQTSNKNNNNNNNNNNSAATSSTTNNNTNDTKNKEVVVVKKEDNASHDSKDSAQSKIDILSQVCNQFMKEK